MDKSIYERSGDLHMLRPVDHQRVAAFVAARERRRLAKLALDEAKRLKEGRLF